MMLTMVVGLLLATFALSCRAFSPAAFITTSRAAQSIVAFAEKDEFLSVSLEKPLGMMLEEVEDGAPKGVLVQDIGDSGSASESEFRDQMVGLRIARIMGEDVTALDFDSVMDRIIEAPSPLAIDFEKSAAEEPISDDESEDESDEPSFEVGTEVTINIVQQGQPDVCIKARVGDNLRQVMLDNGIEVYKGLKQKLGNCGGSGQCTFCAVDFIESEGWYERSEWEDGKLRKNPNARLACLNNIQGPATFRL